MITRYARTRWWGVLLALSLGTLAAGEIAAGTIVRHSFSHNLATGDFDGDGAADAVWILPGGDLRIYSPSTGQGGTLVGPQAYAVVGADITDGGDGVDELIYLRMSNPDPAAGQEIRALSIPGASDVVLPGVAHSTSKLTSGDWDDDGDDGYVVTGTDGNLYGGEPTPGGIVYNSPSGVGQLASYVGGDFVPGRAGDEFAGFNAGTNAYLYNGGTSNAFTDMAGSGLNAITAGNVNPATAGDEVLAAVRGNELWRWNQTGWARLPGAGASVAAGSVDPALAGLEEWFVIGDPPGHNIYRFVGNANWVQVTGMGGWNDLVLADFDGDNVDEILAMRGDTSAPYIHDVQTTNAFQRVDLPWSAAGVPINSRLQLWLDAGDNSTIVTDGGGNVEQWLDKSGNNHHATQSAAAERPTLNGTALNGQPAIRFDGVDDGMAIDDALSLGRPYTAFIVDQYYGGVQGRTLQGQDANWLMGKWGQRDAHYAGGFVYDPGAGNSSTAIGDAVGNPTSSEYFLNGRNVTQDPAPTGSPGRLGLVGEGQFPGEQSQADVAEVIVFDRALSLFERAQVGQYLGQKYGIPTAYTTHMATREWAFSGGDPGEGLDMQGDFLHAVNVRGPGGFSIGDAAFTDDTGVVVAENEILNWIAPDYGPSPDDDGLETVMQSIRWTATGNGGQETLDVTLPNLVPGRTYKVQMLFGDNTTVNRHFSVDIEGSRVVGDFNEAAMSGSGLELGAALTHQFVATDDTLNVVLDGAGVSGGDRNPILQGITVEDLGVTGQTTVGTFTGGDPGEGLDLDGDFLAAVNIRGPGGFQVRDAAFTADDATPGVTVSAENEILNWIDPNYGDTPNDDALEGVMQSMRWTDTNGRGETVWVDVEGLEVGQDYALQLLFGEGCCDRGFDVVIDDTLVADDMSLLAQTGGAVDPNLGIVLRHEFTADDETLHIVLDGFASGLPDGNPILNALTLEAVAAQAIPEPSSLVLALLAGLGLAAWGWRRRGAWGVGRGA